jgi:hypothetical protein
MENMGRRLRFGEDPDRLGNMGRGLCVVAGTLFVLGWATVLYLAFSDDALSNIRGGRAQTLISFGGSVTFATSLLLLAGIAMRMFASWLLAQSGSEG